MASTHWQRVTSARLSRRRLLAATGATAAGTALLAACGGGSSGSSSGGSSSPTSLITAPADTSATAKSGGTNKYYIASDPASFDVSVAQANLEAPQGHVYSRLTQIKAGHLAETDYSIIPDLAESWEWSPDRLQLTMKLRQGVKWHNKPPVNARAFDVEDVLFSWNRYATKASNHTQLVNAADPNAPVLSVSSPDSSTVVFKLKYPLVYLLSILGNYLSGNVTIFPKETDGTFDVRKDMIGTGPFTLGNYQSSIGFTFKKNPDYYVKGLPYLDSSEMPIITEYAAALAQFKAGNIYTYAVNGEDIIALKDEMLEILVYQGPYGLASQFQQFGWLPAGKSPFLDERVRQAVSLSWDRDLFIDTYYNVSKFQSQGLPVSTRWNSGLPATYEGYWLDPKGKDFGPNAKYFSHDIAMAKQLLAAAGYPNGIDFIDHVAANGYADTYRKQVQVLDGMSAEAGIKATNEDLVDYVTVFQPKYRDSKGQFEGWCAKSSAGNASDALVQMSPFYSKLGVQFLGFDAGGKGDASGDPQVDAMFENARGEIDDNKRKAIIQDMQRYLAQKMYGVQWPGGATTFQVAWPALQNFRVFNGDQRQGDYNWWIDSTKSPLGKA